MNKSPQKYEEYRRAILVGALIGVGLALVFIAGFLLREVIDIPPVFANHSSRNTGGYPLLDEVQVLLDNHYLRPQPDYTQRQYAAIRGMLAQLGDPNTFFIDPPVAKSESDVLAGTYGGIGVEVDRNAEGNFVLYPFPGGPATNSGIRDGDILFAVNGSMLDSVMQLDAVDQMLRGEVKDDNGVEISIRHGDDEITVFIKFDVINVPSVLWRVLAEDERLGYVHILRFTSRTPDELIAAVNELKTSGIMGLVLDLRDNTGGLLQESVQVASVFLDGGVVVYEKTNSNETALMAGEGGAATELPLVVIVNGGTASAAELVAGAIQDRHRGPLIGQTTYGKGTIQQIFTLSDSSSVHVTSAEWLTPNRNTLDGIGLEPDISMIPDENGRDIEIGEAIRYLREQIATESIRTVTR